MAFVGSWLGWACLAESVVAALGRLLVAAEAASKVRSGLKPDEVILALAGLWELDPAGDWQAQAQQLYQLVFAGLRPD